jgi:uncharacterized protein (TIGR02266 family)
MRETRDTIEDLPAVAETRISKESRASKRMELKTEIHMASASNFYTGFTGNVSEGGLFVATYNLVPLGTRVSLEFSLPDDGPAITAVGEVRWTSDPTPDGDGHVGLGLQFVDLAEADRQRIERFVRQRETLFYD